MKTGLAVIIGIVVMAAIALIVRHKHQPDENPMI